MALGMASYVWIRQVNLAHKQNELAKLTFLLSNIESNISHYYTSLSLVKADAHKEQILIYIDDLDKQRKQIMSSIDKLYK